MISTFGVVEAIATPVSIRPNATVQVWLFGVDLSQRQGLIVRPGQP